MKEYNKLSSIFIITFIFLVNISYEQYIKVEDVRKALQEVAYSYYMRGKNIQYNAPKVHIFSPEEATSQNINFMVCSGFTKNVYRELLNISLPMPTGSLLSYSKENVGSPEVVAYSHVNEKKEVEMKIYSPNQLNSIKTLINPSIKDIIPLVQVGDILCYTGHTFLIYDIEKDSTGKVIDAIIMESGFGIGRAYANSKISVERFKLSNGNEYAGSCNFLYLNSKLNTDFKEGRVQGSIGLNRLSTYKNWVNINNTKLRKDEYCILRFIQKDSDGNAILKYKANNKSVPNIVELKDILNYKIVIKNFGNKMYNYNLIVYENLPKYVTFLDHQENNAIISFNH